MPSSTLVCEGFAGLAAATSIGLGVPTIPLAIVPGHTNVQSRDELKKNLLEVTLGRVIDNLTTAPVTAIETDEPGARDIFFEGGFDALNDYFYDILKHGAEHDLNYSWRFVSLRRARRV